MITKWYKAMAMVCVTALAVHAQEWSIEEVDVGTKPELVLDSAGNPHIAFMTEEFDGGVFYAIKEGEEWAVETVSNGYFYGPLELAMDVDDNPHIVYHDHQDANTDPSSGDAAYAFRDNNGWQVEAIADEGHDGWDASIAVDEDGQVYVVSIDPSQFGSLNGIEWAVRLSRGTWSVGILGSGPVPYEFGTQSAVDSQGRLHVVYHDGSEQLNVDSAGSDLYYAVLDGGDWQVQTVDEEGDVGKFASLVLDGDGLPHIAYFEWDTPSTGYVKYAHSDGNSWQRERLDRLDDIEIAFLGARRLTSIALDRRENPHVAYSDRSQLRYAIWSEGGWDIQTVVEAPSGGILGQLTSLALGEDGVPHIAYYELPERPSSSFGTIFYAVGQTPTAVQETAVTPAFFALHGNFPNPFNASTILRFELDRALNADLSIYNLAGQHLRTLVRGQMEVGAHRVRWDGTDAQGRPAASGLYLARLRAGDSEIVDKMLLLR